METTEDFDGDLFRKKLYELRDTKREALADALVRLETAAWGRRWTALQAARNEIEKLTGITITGPLRRELEESRTD